MYILKIDGDKLLKDCIPFSITVNNVFYKGLSTNNFCHA